eukprot:COSAG03_NODE_6804_length_1003_cov_1.719027_1_plen_77_part_10
MVYPRGDLFFCSPTRKGNAVDSGGMGVFPHSGGGGAGTARKDVLFEHIPLFLGQRKTLLRSSNFLCHLLYSAKSGLV